jgi:Yip1 domain
MAAFVERMIGAAKLEVATYEEVEADQNALGQAIGVVVLSAVASGIGALGGGVSGLLTGIVAALVGWFVWAGIIFLVGTKVLPEPQTKADLGQLLRTMGFAASPGVFNVLGIIPLFGWIVRFAVMIWQLIAMVIAVRAALDYQNAVKAVLVCLIGWVAYVAAVFILGSVLGLGRMMF